MTFSYKTAVWNFCKQCVTEEGHSTYGWRKRAEFCKDNTCPLYAVRPVQKNVPIGQHRIGHRNY